MNTTGKSPCPWEASSLGGELANKTNMICQVVVSVMERKADWMWEKIPKGREETSCADIWGKSPLL